MEKMKKRFIVDFTWKTGDDGISKNLEEKIQQEAFSRITKMLSEQYVCGELACSGIDEAGNEYQYSGWWEINEIDLSNPTIPVIDQKDNG